ncbi:13650_t:CDS:2 [Entrophospora sp. SA101]|nr:13650_t:CDS:2 [Entrophospora sp. SA101]
MTSEIKNAQNWLKEKYKDKNTEKIIDIGKGIEFEEGELKIEEYTNLTTIKLGGGKKITKLTITNCPNVEEIDVYDNEIAQIIALKDDENLEDDLSKLSGLPNLKKLRIQNNQIKKLDVSGNKKLGFINCFGNEDLKIIEETTSEELDKILKESIKKELGEDALQEFIAEIEIPTKNFSILDFDSDEYFLNCFLKSKQSNWFGYFPTEYFLTNNQKLLAGELRKENIVKEIVKEQRDITPELSYRLGLY